MPTQQRPVDFAWTPEIRAKRTASQTRTRIMKLEHKLAEERAALAELERFIREASGDFPPAA